MDIEIVLREIDKYLMRPHDYVVDFKTPTELASLINFDLTDTINDDTHLIEILEQIIQYSVHTDNPQFYNQLYTGTDRISAISDLITTLLNTSMYTYEMAPVFSTMEKFVHHEILKRFRFEDGAVLPTTGGSMANIMAVHAARYNLDPTMNQYGTNTNLKVYISEAAHYSFKKALMLLGIGSNSIVSIKTIHGRMCLTTLRAKIQETRDQHDIPLMVVATAGTTVQGKFDPILNIATICRKESLWLHVDAAWGGSMIFSENHSHLLSGIEFANSMTWNAHKMLGITQQCSFLLLRDRDVYNGFNKIENVSYLFQADKPYPSEWDSGPQHIQCGRRVDILKLWLTWKIKGNEFGCIVDKLVDLAYLFQSLIIARPNFELIVDNIQAPNVCFRYVPESIDSNDTVAVHQLAPQIKKEMLRRGKPLIGYQPIEYINESNCFRIVFVNPKVTEEDLQETLDLIEEIGADLFQ